MKIRCCERCGAVVALSTMGDGVDNDDVHEDWHIAVEWLLALLTEGAQANANALKRARAALSAPLAQREASPEPTTCTKHDPDIKGEQR